MVKDDQLPVIGILPEKRWRGINNLNDKSTPLSLKSFTEAFTHPFDSDAHFVCYSPAGTGIKAFPRCNKPVLSKIRTEGADLLTTCMVLDYDNPGHQPWTREALSQWLQRLSSVADKWPLARQWTLLYTTRNGARLVYVLKEPIPVDQAESKHCWLCQEFCRQGIEMDTACSDWTRVFRLPYVTRDKKPTWDDEILEHQPQYQNKIDANDLLSADKVTQKQYAQVREFTDPKPDVDYAVSLLKEKSNDTGHLRQSDWFKRAKKQLRGRECYDCLFGHAALAEPGERDNRIHTFVGMAVSLLFYMEGTTPPHIYGVFLDSVQQLDPDEQTPDWTDVLWSAIGRLWVKEEAKEKAKQEQEEKESEEALTLTERVLYGMREWCDHPVLHGDDKEATAWMSKHLIATLGKKHYIMSPSGRYFDFELEPTQLISQIRALGMNKIIDITIVTEKGITTYLQPSAICSRHSTNIKRIEGIPGLPGGSISSIGGENASLKLPLYRRNEKLEPAFNADVAEWLEVLFGEDHDMACKWIAWALAFEDGPICALSIVGGQGVGKKMLIEGLSECLEYPHHATVSDLAGQYQYGLRQSPFLSVNEGWPSTNQGLHPADQFRAIVAGDAIEVKEKFKAPVFVKNPVRVIFTANNLDVIRKLTKNRELSPEDREALTIRLLHFDVGSDASDWLSARGGIAFTGSQGNRWIGGDSAGDSDYVIAKHFLWLYQNRKGPVGKRFLVEGGNNKDIIFDMQTQSGSSPLVIEAIIHMLESSQVRQGMVVENGRLFVLSSEIVSYFRASMSQATRQTLTTTTVGRSLQSVVVGGRPTSVVLDSRKERGQARWHELDVGILLRFANNDGWPCSKLEQLVREQRAKGML